MKPWQNRCRTCLRRCVDGFSLVELLVSLTIIAILAASALGVYQIHLQQAYREQAKIQLLALAQNLHDYYLQYQVFADTAISIEHADRYHYFLEIMDNQQKFILTAEPQHQQSGDGLLYLDADGNRRHYSADSIEEDYQLW